MHSSACQCPPADLPSYSNAHSGGKLPLLFCLCASADLLSRSILCARAAGFLIHAGLHLLTVLPSLAAVYQHADLTIGPDSLTD
eukprot:3181668-Pleurochrysis_carterae.AAC.1